MIEDWPAQAFAAQLAGRERVLVLFHAGWCPFSRTFMPTFEKAEPEANVPFARADLRHPMDARWDAYRVHIVPTLAYYEHGEELERVDGIRHRGLSKRDLDEMLALVDSIQEEPRLPKRMHGLRRS